MSRKVLVILSGCGVMDGSEIHESVCTLLALDKAGAEITIAAPNKEQHDHINHSTGQPASEKRNVLQEAARIARGKIRALSDVKIDDFDAAIFPGGSGAAKNLSSWSYEGENYSVDPEIDEFIKKANDAKKAMGFVCIAPMIAAKVLGNKGVKVTIGNDQTCINAIKAQGAKHEERGVNEITVDENLKVVSTPAYMLGKSIKDIEPGITALVNKIMEL